MTDAEKLARIREISDQARAVTGNYVNSRIALAEIGQVLRGVPDEWDEYLIERERDGDDE